MFMNIVILLAGFSMLVGLFWLTTTLTKDVEIAFFLLFSWSIGLGAFLLSFYKIMIGV